MTDTLFEQLGGTYTQVGDYALPDLSLPAEKDDRPMYDRSSSAYTA